MKKIVWLLSICLSLFADDIVVFENEYKVLELDKKVKKIIVGNQELMNISLLNESSSPKTTLKLFGKKSGNTSILVLYRDGSIGDFHIYVNQNLGYLQKMINTIEPNLRLSKVGDSSTVISGIFSDPHQKTKIMDLLVSGGIDASTLMDLTQTTKVNKMIRTKLYLVEVNNNKAKELGGVTGIGIFNEYANLSLNPDSITGATFSGFLLDHTANYTAKTGNSVVGTLKFLEEQGVATILDDTVLITTEENNASFHVGGEVYIPVGLTQNTTGVPTIQLEEKEYGLRLTLKTKFMEKDDFMHMDIQIKDSEFDTNHEHDVKLGENTSVPSFISKNIDTDIVAKSKQVIVLGGRLHTEELNYEEKIPFLGDIPLLGELFKNKRTMKKNNDLLFFLVPEIVDANKDINDTNFYRDFKNENLQFHEDILDTNSSKGIKAQETIVAPIEVAQVIDSHEPLMEIELEGTDTEILVDEPQKQVETLVNEEKKYAVATAKIFLRDKPIDGAKASIWGKDHTFTVAKEEEHFGSVWLKVKDDCLNGCVASTQELWISKKYTKEL